MAAHEQARSPPRVSAPALGPDVGVAQNAGIAGANLVAGSLNDAGWRERAESRRLSAMMLVVFELAERGSVSVFALLLWLTAAAGIKRLQLHGR